MSELPKTFDPAALEAKWYAHWEKEGLFRPDRPDAQPYTIVNPPPNVTGSLHIGHALDNTLQDIMIRYERLRGKDALWVVGTDHAGIATQMVVERQMAERQDKRTNYTREEFIEKVWEWKRESGGTITGQLRRLGCSMDWALNSEDGNGQFTMDPHFSRAVTKVFVDLYNTVKPDGTRLLYRDKRLVNWDPGLKTAISDLEVETREVQGKFWHFRYPLADGVTLDDGRDYIVVATTRPETMLADMAVAVNGADERYASVVGKFVELPITGRRIPIVADDHADPELGSGAVKITPGHDFNDFEVGKRAGIAPADMLNMLDADAKVVQTADGLIPADYLGLDRFDARTKVVEALRALDRLDFAMVTVEGEDGPETVRKEKIEDRVIQTPYGDRSGVVIEPWLTDQWYVDAATLAKPAIEAVRSGAVEIVPKSWEKTYFNWMENIQPWCVSRQLWWGHRIPVWYGPPDRPRYWNESPTDYLRAGENFVCLDEAAATTAAWQFYGEPTKEVSHLEAIEMISATTPEDQLPVVPLVRDPDVLDTWFSSALWPFATLGWPPESESANALLARHYPNDLLISGFDILFFWDARMLMQGIEFMGEHGAKPLEEGIPWRKLYLHGLVRAADGAKMSKSKGNVVDPLGLIDRFGADALRFFMSAMESQGRDIKMDDKRVEGYRNFATKLWNATRFAMSNGIGASASLEAPRASLAVNTWIIGEVAETVAALDKAFADLRFDAAANTIYAFVWNSFCDWYLELIKGAIDDETRGVAGWVLDQILVMLHPFMPFITEELWHALGERSTDLIVARWPKPGVAVEPTAKAEIEWLIKLVSEVRAARAELNIAPGAKLALHVRDAEPATLERVERLKPAVSRMARIEGWSFDPAPAGGSAQVVVDEATYVLPLEGIIDIAAEKARLTKAMEAAAKEAKSLEGRLNNPAFVEKAKPEAVEKARADHAEKSAEAARLAAALERLG